MDTITITPPAQQTVTPPQSPKEQPMKHRSPFYEMLGKFLVIVFIAGGLLGGGYYLGIQQHKTANIYPTPTPIPTEFIPSPLPTQATIINASPSAAPGQVISAGRSSQGSFLKQYTIIVPMGWNNNHRTDNISDILTLTKENYSLTIFQAPIDGSGCVYGNDPEVAMTQHFAYFVSISGASGIFRRGWNTDNKNTLSYTICEKDPTNNDYGTLTLFGAISAISPLNPDPTIMTQLDAMIASLTQK